MATKKKPTQLDRIEKRLGLIESSLAVLRSGATFMQELDKAKEEPQPIGLLPGDYTDASKETADALTEMGWGWVDDDRTDCSFLRRAAAGASMMINVTSRAYCNTYLDPAEFLSRAAVTAKEIGLVPVEAIKVGDLVEVVGPAGLHGNDRHRGVVDTAKEWKTFCTDQPTFYLPKVDCWYEASSLRRLSAAEIAAHLAEQEARANAEKLAKLKFGVWVNTPKGKGIYLSNDERDGQVWIAEEPEGDCNWLELSDITVIDPQP